MFRARIFFQSGLSIVELMVALAISMVLITAALMLFSETRSSQRAVDQIANANETGSFVIKLVGRDVVNAGFYPVDFVETNIDSALGGYFNILNKPAYEFGIFGCDGSEFNVETSQCGPNDSDKPDSIVVGYFTSDGFGGVTSHRFDCEGLDVAEFSKNSTRASPSGVLGSHISPERPLFVANHYTLSSNPQTVQVYENEVTTRSFACKGLVSPARRQYTPLISGIDDFQVEYGMYSPGASDGYDIKFVPASMVLAEGPVTTKYGQTFPPWKRVVAIRVCVIAKTYGISASSVSTSPSWTKCDGTEGTPVAGDRAVRKTYFQTFAVRNRLNMVY